MFDTPFAAPEFTLRLKAASAKRFELMSGDEPRKFRRVEMRRDLVPDTWFDEKDAEVVCLDLPKGRSKLSFS
ncbi:MAG: hypothetical protein MI757_12845 [Pirellulales bacterium]|nr:hypothetical protein [Pirellulales bacterium]